MFSSGKYNWEVLLQYSCALALALPVTDSFSIEGASLNEDCITFIATENLLVDCVKDTYYLSQSSIIKIKWFSLL